MTASETGGEGDPTAQALPQFLQRHRSPSFAPLDLAVLVVECALADALQRFHPTEAGSVPSVGGVALGHPLGRFAVSASWHALGYSDGLLTLPTDHPIVARTLDEVLDRPSSLVWLLLASYARINEVLEPVTNEHELSFQLRVTRALQAGFFDDGRWFDPIAEDARIVCGDGTDDEKRAAIERLSRPRVLAEREGVDVVDR